MRWVAVIVALLLFPSVASAQGAKPQTQSLDSEAPPGSPPHWLPNERWVMQHWIPYDETRLYSLLGITRGAISSTSRSSTGIQCATSGAFGSRFFGGRAFTTFVIQTSARTSPASASNSSSSFPARPTNGRPS